MKKTQILLGLTGGIFLFVISSVPAAEIKKGNTGNVLNNTASWVGGIIPTNNDVAVWDSTVTTAARCTNGLNVAMTWAGIKIIDPIASVHITNNAANNRNLFLGASGIDMSAATVDLTMTNNLTVNASQTWNIANNRTFTLWSNQTACAINNSLNITGGGIVQFARQLDISSNSTVTLDGGSSLIALPANESFIRVGASVQGGTITQIGGTLSLARMGTGNIVSMQLGISDFTSTGAKATYNLSGGTLIATNATTNSYQIALGQNAGGASIMNVSGSAQCYADRLIVGGAGPGTLNISDLGAVFIRNTFVVANAVAGIGVVNLNGGSLNVPGMTRNSAGLATNNFNGGTLVAGTNNPFFMQAGFILNVLAGGARIDTAGYDITIDQPFLHASGGTTDGGLQKFGSGTLTLSGLNDYNGDTVIKGGKLVLSTVVQSKGAIALDNNTTLGLTLSGAGVTLYCQTLTLGTSVGSVLEFNLNGFGNPTAPVLIASNLTANGICLVNILGTGLAPGQFPLIQYTNATGVTDATFVTNSLPNGLVAYMSNNVANSTIDLVVVSAASILWTGSTNSVPVGIWDVGVTTNWIDPATSLPAAFSSGTSVRFDDSAPGTTTITLAGEVAPGNTVISNETKAYSIAGVNAIAGTGRFIKEGAADLTLSTPNTYSGDTLISAGKLILGTTNVIPDGVGKGDVVLNGTLDTAGFNETINGLSGSGVLDNSLAGVTNTVGIGNNNAGGTFSGTVVNSGGVLILSKQGNGIITLSGNNTYSGGTMASGTGILQLGHPNALGTGPLTMAGGTLSSDSTTSRTITNDLFMTGNNTYGSSSNTGVLTLSGNIDFGGAIRTLNINSDVIFAGTSLMTNGGLNIKNSPGTLTIRSNLCRWFSAIEVRGGAFVVDGATLTNGDAIRINSILNNGVSRFVITNGGLVVITNPASNLRPGYTGGNATATNIADIAGTLRLAIGGTAGGVDMGQLSARAIVNLLPGGVLEARQIVHNSGVSEFNFRGGILRVTTNSAGTNFMQGLTVANVQDGGAVIDTAGFDITIGQALLAGGTAGLSKQGLGMLTLAGTNNTYTGTTVINQGRVAWRSTNFTASPVLVKNGAACRAIVSTVGSAIGIPAVTLGESAGQTTTLDVDLGTLGFPTVAPVIITNFTTRGTVRIGFVGSGLTVGGPFPLIQYEGGTINGDGWAAIQAAPPAGTQVTLTDDGTTIYAEITSSEAIRWTGAANTNWDIAISTNWLSGVDAIAYTEGSAVRFEDGAAAANVYLLTTLRPSGIVVSNNSLNYTFFGPGLIAGGYGLTKSGAGSLTISNTGSTYSNDTVIEAGTLILGTNNVIPDGTNRGLAVVNGTLDLAGYNETINGLSGNGIVDTTTADKTNILTINALTNSTFAGNIRNSGLNSVLSVTKTGTNVITLAGLSTYSGYTSNDNGALRVGANQALGTGRILMYGGTLASDSVNARVLPNALFCNAGITLGDSNNTGTLTFNGTVDLNAAARNVTTLSDIVFAGGSTNGRANKLGPATLTLKGGHLWNGDAETRNGTLILDGAMLTNSGAFRPDGDQTNGLARVVITNGSWLVLTSATSNLRIGSDALTGATNIVDVAAAVRMPVADGANGRIILGQDCARGILNTFPGADLEVRTFEHASVASEVNFNGGIVRAKTNSLLYMQGLTVVNILNGGISFDSAGWDISIRQSMQGTGGLTKIGTGILRLVGANTYTGENTVAQGTLWMNSLSQNGNAILVGDGATLAVEPAAPASTLSASSLTLGSVSGAALEVNLPFGEGTNAPLIRVGSLAAPAPVTINLAAVITPGRYTLIQYTNVSGTLATFNLGTKPATVLATLTHDSIGKTVYLEVTGVDTLSWTGVGTNIWDLGISTNWMLASSQAPTSFQTGDNVLFDDSGSNAATISLVSAMAPSALTVLNTNVDFTMTSAGKLSGAMMLLKDGPGSLTLSNENDYTGLTRVQGGTLVLGRTNALGSISGATYITNGGTLDLNGISSAYEPVFVAGTGVSNNGAIINRGGTQNNAFRDVTMAGDATFGGTGRWDIRAVSATDPGLRANGYNLTKVGTGIVGIRAENGSYWDTGLGSIDIQAGILTIEYNTTLGLATGNLSVNSNGTFQVWQLISTNVLTKNFFMTNGSLIAGSTAAGATNTLSGPIVIEGSNAFRLNANGPTTNRLIITGPISGPGALTRDFNMMTNSDMTLELQGTNSYFGPTVLREGRTVLGPQATLFNTASIELGSNVVFDLSAVPGGLNLTNQTLRGEGTLLGSVTAIGGTVLPGGDGTAKTLTLSNSAAFADSEFKLDLSQATTLGGGTNDLLVVGGNLALTGSNLVSLSFIGGVSPTGGTYTIIRYTGTLTGGATNLYLKTHSYIVTFDDTVPNEIRVTVTPGAQMLWVGGVPGMERVWDTAATNWSWGSATVAFFSGDVVRLDDTVNPAYRSVLLSSPIISSLIAVDTASEYQFGGDGKLTGATTLTKTGNGKLVITNAGVNDFGGQLNIAGGSVEVGAGDILGTLGAGLINISNAASLALNRSDDITVANTLTGTGVLEKRGTNVLTLSGTSLNYAGTVLVSSGTLKAGNINAFGGTNVGGTTIASGATLDVNALRLTNEAFIASGPGVNGQGAIINSTNTGQNNALRMLTLAGDVTFGGVGRWDVRSTDLTNMPAYLSTGSNAYNITKVGTNQVTLVSVNVDPAQYNVNINEGGFGYESFSSFGDPAGTVTVASNAYFWLHNLSNAFTKLMVFQGGASFINNAGANTIGSLVTLNGDATMDTRGTSSLTFSNTISGLGGLLKTNSGTLVLAAPNTYQGPTTIRGGTLDISAETALGPNPATYQPAWLTLDGTILKASASFDLDDPNRGVFADVGGVTFNTLSNGTLRVLNVISGPGSVKKATAGGTLVLGESNTFTGPMYFGPGALQGTVIVSRVVNSLLPSSIGMSSLDASNLVLAGAVFRYVGPRTESDRLFTVDTGVGNALLDASGTGALRFTNTLPAFVSAAAGVRNWHIGGTNMDDNLIAPSISDTAISNATVIWKDGPGRWILAGTNRYTGKTQITGGTLQIDDEIRLGANPPTNFVADQLTFDGGYLRITANMAFDDLNRGTTVTTNGGGFDVDTNVTVAVTRPITGAGSLSKIGAGTLVLSNSHTFASNTLVNAGTMLVQGILDIRTAPVTVNDTGTLGGNGTIERPVVVNAGGILSPGNSVGTLTVNNSVTLNAGSTNYMEIDKTNPQSNDVITATSFNLGGTLVVRITGGSVQVDDVFKLFNGSLNGLFTAVDLPVLSGGLGWDQSRLQVDGTLKVVAGGAAPTWVLQPINTTINYGSNVILTVLANGTPEPAYYWFKSGNASPISVTSNLVLNAVKLSDAGNYFAVASNSVAAIISTTNTVTVLYQLPAPMVGLSSNTFGFEIQAETNRAYWLESRTSLISGSWVVISGITNASGATNLLDAAAVETNKFYRIGTQPSN